MSIIAITTFPDPHIDMVNSHLTEPIIVIDPSKYPNELLSFSLEGNQFHLIYERRRISIQSIWYRKPIFTEPNEVPVEAFCAKYTHDSYQRFYKSLYGLFRESKWVSDPWMIFRASNKLLQIELAKEVGLNVPETIVSNDQKSVVEFIKSHNYTVTKSLSAQKVVLEGVAYGLYTTKIDESVDLSGLSLAPAIFQERITNQYDIRVTVIGQSAYSCKITKLGKIVGEVDWRIGNFTEFLQYEMFEFELEKKCVELVRLLGLKFGVIEFICDENGILWFIEVNPNGQWGFIEIETGFKLSKMMASFLTE